ncbi:recombinase family protein [Tessaracoccus sp. Z1128]
MKTDQPQDAVIYVRLSQDSTGEGVGVKSQREMCLEMAERRGWHVVEVCEDNDISAYSGKRRPGFERMLELVAKGSVRYVVVRHVDRIMRSLEDTARFSKIGADAGVVLSTVLGGDMDLGTAAGQFQVSIMSSVARNESQLKGERQKIAAARDARKGKRNGRRHFGYDLIKEDGRVVREVINEREAEVIRWMADRVLLGASIRSIVTELNDRLQAGDPTAVKPSQGDRWNLLGVRRLLLSAHIAGLRTHHGEVVAVGSQWDPIIDRATHDRLTRLLRDPKRQTNGATLGRKLLLSGFARCGDCGEALYSRPRPLIVKGQRVQAKDAAGELLWHTRQGDPRPVWATQDTYACVSGNRHGARTDGRHFLRIKAEWLDEHVARQIMARLTEPGSAVLSALAEANDQHAALELAQKTIDDAERSLRELADDYYVQKLMDRQTFLQTQAHLQAVVRDGQRQVMEATGDRFISQLPTTADDLRRAYEENDVVWRRALITAVAERVVVQRATLHGSNKFDPARVEIHYRY